MLNFTSEMGKLDFYWLFAFGPDGMMRVQIVNNSTYDLMPDYALRPFGVKIHFSSENQRATKNSAFMFALQFLNFFVKM